LEGLGRIKCDISQDGCREGCFAQLPQSCEPSPDRSLVAGSAASPCADSPVRRPALVQKLVLGRLKQKKARCPPRGTRPNAQHSRHLRADRLEVEPAVHVTVYCISSAACTRPSDVRRPGRFNLWGVGFICRNVFHRSGCTKVVAPIAGLGPLCGLSNSAIAEITLQNFRKLGKSLEKLETARIQQARLTCWQLRRYN
jgi:hypothetical protein